MIDIIMKILSGYINSHLPGDNAERDKSNDVERQAETSGLVNASSGNISGPNSTRQTK